LRAAFFPELELVPDPLVLRSFGCSYQLRSQEIESAVAIHIAQAGP